MVLCDYEAPPFVKKLATKLPKRTLKLFCKRKALKLRWYLFGNLHNNTGKASLVGLQVIAQSYTKDSTKMSSLHQFNLYLHYSYFHPFVQIPIFSKDEKHRSECSHFHCQQPVCPGWVTAGGPGAGFSSTIPALVPQSVCLLYLRGWHSHCCVLLWQ